MSSSCTPYPSDEANKEGNIMVHLLEFKTRLLEAVAELQIHRDAEIQCEEQINKLVLEKQELEWQKESLQHHIDTLGNEHRESVTSIKNQFQARIREIEEEKGEYQLTAELKDKEINSLKEELKSLQLSKCSLQKTLRELEQKLHLQVQTKDSHLNQLSEVERRFGSVSRQFASVRQAHEKLEQKAGEAMRLNKNLSSLNKKQEFTITCLKQQVEKINSELIKSKVLSACKSDEDLCCPVKDQQKKLQHNLHVQTTINKNLSEEISALRAEKQEVMNSLQQAQRLLQMQTKAIGRVELELRRQREEHQALKREHELLQAKTREREDRFVSLTEEYKNSKTKQEREQKILFDEVGEFSEGHDHLDKQPKPCKEEQHTRIVQGSLKDYSQNGMAENADVFCDVICKTKKARRECVLLQNDKELVQLCCPARTKQDLSDADKTGDSGHVPDEGRDPAPTEPRKTVNDGLPQPDYCTAIKAQGAYVYIPGHADMEGTEQGDRAADPATNPNCTALEPPGSSSASAVVPAGVTLSADAVDTLGVCGASAGQQAPDSWVIQPCMGTTHPGNCTLNEAPVFSSSVPCKYDFIKALSGSESYANHTVECGEEVKEGSKKKEIKSMSKNICRVTDEYGRVAQKGTKIECDSTTDSVFVKRYPNKANEEALKSSCPPRNDIISESTITTPLASVRSSFSTDSGLESKVSDKDSHPQVVMNQEPDMMKASSQNYLSISSVPNSVVVIRTEANCTLLESKTPDKTDITAVDSSFLKMDLASRSAILSKTSDEESCIQNEARQKFKDQHIFVCDLESTDVKESSAFNCSDNLKKNETSSISIPTEYIQNEINLNSDETDSIFVPGNKRFRSSFELWVPTKGMKDQMVRQFNGFESLLKGNQNISTAQTVSRNLGFLFKSQDVPSSHTTSKTFLEDSIPEKDSPKIKSTADMLNISSVHPCRKREL